jgi:hypothetical protein
MLVLVCYACCGEVCDLPVHAYLCCYYLPTLDSNDIECTEEGEVYEYQEEEDQGQATQGKPSTCAYLNPNNSLCMVLLLFSYYALFSILLLFSI